jgi:hypothetical protein
VVDVSEEGVTVRPIPDVTTIILGALAVIGLALLTARGAGANGRRLFAFLRPGE